MTDDRDDRPFYAGTPGGPPELPPVSIVPGGGAGTPLPRPPRGLGAAGRAAWRRYWSTGRRWLDPAANRDLVLMIAEAVDDRAELRRALQRSDMVTTGSRKQLVLNPIVRQIDQTDAKLADLLKRAGFQPVEQRRLIGAKRQSRLRELRDRKDKRDDR